MTSFLNDLFFFGCKGTTCYRTQHYFLLLISCFLTVFLIIINSSAIAHVDICCKYNQLFLNLQIILLKN